MDRVPSEPDVSARSTGRVAAAAVERVAFSSSLILRIVLGTGVAVAVIALGVAHRAAVDAGGDSLAGADGEWLALAALATVGMWLAGTVSLFGAIPVRPPLRRVFAVQIAASFANHLLPAGSGGAVVNVRFLRRYGLSRGVAVGAIGLNSLVTGVTHLALLAGALVIAPSTLEEVGRRGPRHGRVPLPHGGWGIALLIAFGALVVLLATLRRPRAAMARGAARVAARLREVMREMEQLRAVLRHPGRAVALWLGSLSMPLCHAVILVSVLRSLGVPATLGTIMVIYLGVSALAAIVPSPGAIGGLDVALAAALAAVGVSSAVAIGAMLGYRLITVWLPLLPAAFVFAVLLRRRII